MRSFILVLIVAVIAVIGAIHFGLIDIAQTRPAALPQVQAEGGTVRASGGQTPAFDVATGSVEVKQKPGTVEVPKVTVQTESKNVAVPSVEVQKANPGAANSTSR